MKIIRDCIGVSDDKMCVALNALPLSVASMAPGNSYKLGQEIVDQGEVYL